MNEWQYRIQRAIDLLASPLVWSPDFEAIRPHLEGILLAESESLAPYVATLDLVEALLNE